MQKKAGLHLSIICLAIATLLTNLSCSKKTESPEENKPVIVDTTGLSLRERYALDAKLWPKAWLYDGVQAEELSILTKPEIDADNSQYRHLLLLGRTLFFDARLSSNKISCSTCHKTASAFVDGNKVSMGGGMHTRNTPTLENVWSNSLFFWDGRADNMNEQIKEAITSPIEMNQNWEQLPAKLQAINGYSSLFKDAFGSTEVTHERLTEAIAFFTRTIGSQSTPFDAFLSGDTDKLSDEQLEGLHLFRTKARCINCHNGSLFKDNKFHNLGYALNNKGEMEDGYAIYTKKTEDKGKFKTPGLRNVTRTFPYFHNGELYSLEDVMNVLNTGEVQHINGTLSPYIRPLKLTEQEKQHIIAFLGSLESQPMNVTAPTMPM